MVEDFSNGLSIVPFDADHSVLSRVVVSAEHPWRDLFAKRADPPERSVEPPSTKCAPFRYMYDSQLHEPSRRSSGDVLTFKEAGFSRRETEPHDTIRLCDVEAFRKSTAQKAVANVRGDGAGVISAGSATSSPSIRPVIYRYVDVIKNNIALLEAIHFELFMPDRPDLRFLALPCASVPAGSVEGDYFRVPDADLLSDPSFAIKLGEASYPVVWEAKGVEKMKLYGQEEYSALAYIVNRKTNNEGCLTAVVENFDREIPIRETLLPDEDTARGHTLVRVTMRDMATAQLYPVEPHVCESPFMRTLFQTADFSDMFFGGDSNVTGEWKRNERVDKDAEEEEAKKKEREKKKKEEQSEYVKRVSGVVTSSQRFGRVVTAVRALDATEAARIEDRLGAFVAFGRVDSERLMAQLFRLGCRYRLSVSQGIEWKELGRTRIDESVILKTLNDPRIRADCKVPLTAIYCRFPPSQLPAVLAKIAAATPPVAAEPIVAGGRQLNKGQATAVRMYAEMRGPRMFCIRSPPGSGKTTVAAAMAAEVARRNAEDARNIVSVQLLLSVQNVAVDNIGAALKKMDYGGGGGVYNMKSTNILDPHAPSPFDYFDLIGKETVEEWKSGKVSMWDQKFVRYGRKTEVEHMQFKTREECLTYRRRRLEGGIEPKILLATVEMVLQKMYTPSKLCEALKRVNRVIIDEASLLTEAALFCIIRRFPKARIVLIGDEHQLPPFMYDEKILGHELAGRPALSVALKGQIMPIVELTEVYRAPPSLVAPYNRLAYGGKLESKMPEGETPLSDIGLLHSGLPQLLMIDVDGREERNEKTMSLYNEKELEAAVRLLKKFPRQWTKDIMIICLYKEQRNRLQEILDAQYAHEPIPDNLYTVLTVDSAQGKEAPIVILMTTRTQKATDFFCSPERCNVAVSRQQKALIILGKAPLLTTNKPWSTVVNGDDFTKISSDDVQ